MIILPKVLTLQVILFQSSLFLAWSNIRTPECLINILHVGHTYSYYKLQITTELQSLIQTFEYVDAVYKYEFS
jgi:hypothetical protein